MFSISGATQPHVSRTVLWLMFAQCGVSLLIWRFWVTQPYPSRAQLKIWCGQGGVSWFFGRMRVAVPGYWLAVWSGVTVVVTQVDVAGWFQLVQHGQVGLRDEKQQFLSR